MKSYIITLLLIALINATPIHKPIQIIQEERMLIVKQDEVYMIDFGTQFFCSDQMKEKYPSSNDEIIQKGMQDCISNLSVTENREQRRLEVGTAKVCLKQHYSENQPTEYNALILYTDCIIADTVQKYKMDPQQDNSTQNNTKKNNSKEIKGFQQIQDECSSQFIDFNDEKVNAFFIEFNSKCYMQKSDVYLRMRVLEECSKQFDSLLTCIENLTTDNFQAKQSITDYIKCQQDNFVASPSPSPTVIDYLL